MQLFRAASRAGVASIALLSFPLHIYGQSDSTNQNITLRFFQTSQEDSCDYSNSSQALAFTTSSIPLLSHCFDFSDLFSGNVTQGFVNQTENLSPGVWGEAGIHFQLRNTEAFDPQGNYSSVLYRQHVTNAASDNQKPGHYADRRVTIYGGKNCTENDPSSNTALLDWYGFSCWSEDKGSCGTLPYKIASFSIQPGPEEKDQHGTCWVFAKEGAAANIYASSQVIIGALINVFLAIWLAM